MTFRLLKNSIQTLTQGEKYLIRLSCLACSIPHIADRDYERRPMGMPQRLYGRHSLEAWGYRLKCFKGDFGKHDGNDWDTYTPEMLDYCIQDTEVTLKLMATYATTMNDYAPIKHLRKATHLLIEDEEAADIFFPSLMKCTAVCLWQLRLKTHVWK